MRVLLDECLPAGLKAELQGHQTLTVREARLAGKKDGDLLAVLAVAAGTFDVFVTVDRSLQWQQRVASFHLGVILLRAQSNSLPSLRPLVPELLRALERVSPGVVLRVGG